MSYPADSPVSHHDLSAFLQFEDVVDSSESIEYGLEIASFMKHIESKTLPENPNYMDSQPDLSFRMRKTLIVWLVEVHNEYDLRQETLYLAINILDRFCARRLVPRPQYQLLGITALWIAAKYEENHGRVPSLRMLCYICCQNYRERDLVAMEGVVLRELGFELGHPTPEAFLKATVKLMRDQELNASKNNCDLNNVLSMYTSENDERFNTNMYPSFGFNHISAIGAGPTDDDAYRAYADSCTTQYNTTVSSFAGFTQNVTGYLGTNGASSGFRSNGMTTQSLYNDTPYSTYRSAPQQPPAYAETTPTTVSPETRAVARYLMEISTVHARYHRFKPSVLAASALALADHILSEGPLVLPESDTQSSASSKTDDMEDTMRRCEAFLTDCLSDPPKQIFAKYAGGKFLRASMIAERWCKRHSATLADSPSPAQPSPIALAASGRWDGVPARCRTPHFFQQQQQPRRSIRSAAAAVWKDASTLPSTNPEAAW